MRGLMERERRLEGLDGAIALGLADAEAGRVQEIEAVRRELRGAAADITPPA
jgi:antitoxin ParD1/3/4